jgi:threonine dehydrogenase-like Zn-dependent dehydrogenase
LGRADRVPRHQLGRDLKAIGIDTEGILALRDHPEPRLARWEVMVETQTAGICATDREMVRTNQVYSIPSGEDFLILGHEGLGRIIEKGSDVDEFAVGDLVVPVAYRRCEPMRALCRVDMCPYGQDRRRGINTHGFFSEHFVEAPEYLLRVPSELAELAVLLEPLTVTLKGFTEAQTILSRWEDMPCFYRPDDRQRSVLIVGAGPIGLLGIIVARTYGWRTVGVDTVPRESAKAQLVLNVGANYVDATERTLDEIREEFGDFDIVLTAVQDPTALLSYMPLVGMNGTFVIVGWTGAQKEVSFDLGSFIYGLLGRQVSILAPTGAWTPHYEEGMSVLLRAKQSFGDVLDRVITHRYPYQRFQEGFANVGPTSIKTVLDFSTRPRDTLNA